MYKALYNFEGQEGELSLKKDELVGLVERDDNGWSTNGTILDSADWAPLGWWLVKRGDEEGWAPHNYLELVPPKPKTTPAPPPPARRPVPTPAAAVSNGTATKPAVPSAGAAAAKPKPPIATGNKPALVPKPGTGGGKPPVPNATRPPLAAPKPAASGGIKPSGSALGQMDLAAAVSYTCSISLHAQMTGGSITSCSSPNVQL